MWAVRISPGWFELVRVAVLIETPYLQGGSGWFGLNAISFIEF